MDKQRQKRPQVVLLGNGINFAYGGTSWTELLKNIATPNKKVYLEGTDKKLTSPMPLQAILLTEDGVDKALKDYRGQAFGEIKNDDHARTLQKILTMGADEILTTNYSYELEFASQQNWKLSERKLERLNVHTDPTQKAEGKYLIHTRNIIEYDEHTNNVWHIHGEARKPSSMVLGHYYYGNLMFKIKEYVDRANQRYVYEQRNQNDVQIKSWIDSFIFGDVYIIGFGLDLAEIDLWWLLNRKKREVGDHGAVYFYEPKTEKADDKVDERLELIKIFAHKTDGILDMGVTVPAEGDKSALYRTFYEKALDDIANRIKKSKW